MRCVLAAIVATACLAACAGEPLPPERPRGAKAAVEAKKAKKARHGSEAIREKPEGDKVSGDGKAWSGWRYAGSRDDCFFLVGRRCFATEKSACKAAKCGKKRCVGDDGAPPTMRCR